MRREEGLRRAVELDLGWRRQEELFNVVAAIVGKLKMVPFLWFQEREEFLYTRICVRELGNDR